MSKVAVAAVVFLIGAGSAAADERPFVSEVSPYVMNGWLVCDVRSGGLFSERIVSTIQSGLPAVLEATYRFDTRDGKTVSAGIHSLEMSHDVWEDLYSVAGGDSFDTFEGRDAFEQMRDAVQHLRRLPIVPVDELDPSLEYIVSVTIAIHPLTGTEERRVEGFVEESVGARSHETWREQLLSINELISRFFSGDKGTSNRSDVFRTAAFAPGDLPGSKLPVDGGGGGWLGETTVAMRLEVR